MAVIVETKIIACPYCGAKARMKRWSCGCLEIIDGRHKSLNCRGCDEKYFSKLVVICGHQGPLTGHPETDREA